MKVIFLDVDGVLNSDFPTRHQLASGEWIDRERVRLLGEIVRRTGAQLVLHSGWRFWLDEELHPLRPEAEQLLERLGEQGLRLLDKTKDLSNPDIRKNRRYHRCKGKEILHWLRTHPKPEAYVVLEDLDLHTLRLSSHQVRPDSHIGLTETEVERAVEILGES